MGTKEEVSQVIDTKGAVTPSVGSRLVYTLNAYENVYVRFYNPQLDKLWDKNAGAEGAGDSVTWVNSAVPLTDWRTTRGGYLIPVPEDITEGLWDLLFYDNISPVVGDNAFQRLGRSCFLKGGKIQSMDNM